ncbi:MAG: alpha/beta fold hydrolase [Quisquiliibacterium sp.]
MSDRFISRPDGARLRIMDHAARLSVPAAKAPTLVLSNSLATDASLWDDVIARIGARVRLIGYDTRGHGASTSPSASTTLATLADDLFAVMDACGVDKAFVAGISLGGMTGQQCALTRPQRLLGLIACNCRASIDAAGIAGWEQRLEVLRTGGIDALAAITLERWFTPEYRAANPQTIERVRAMIRTTTPVGYEACVRAIQALDLLDAITDIQMPVLLIAGEQDAAASPAAMQAMQKAISGARLEVLDPCGHLSSVQRPDDLAALIEEFIREALTS